MHTYARTDSHIKTNTLQTSQPVRVKLQRTKSPKTWNNHKWFYVIKLWDSVSISYIWEKIVEVSCPKNHLVFRVAAVSWSAAVRARAILLLQRSAVGWGKGPSLCRGQELPAVTLIGQHCQAGAQGWSEPLSKNWSIKLAETTTSLQLFCIVSFLLLSCDRIRS